MTSTSSTDWRGPLWEAINRYVIACGGDPSQHVYGNTPRQTAVSEVERVVREQRSTQGPAIREALSRIARGKARDGGVADPQAFAQETLDATPAAPAAPAGKAYPDEEVWAYLHALPRNVESSMSTEGARIVQQVADEWAQAHPEAVRLWWSRLYGIHPLPERLQTLIEAAAPQVPADEWTRCTTALPAWPEDEREEVLVFSAEFDWGGTSYAVIRTVDFYAQDPDDPEQLGTETARQATHWRRLSSPSDLPA